MLPLIIFCSSYDSGETDTVKDDINSNQPSQLSLEDVSNMTKGEFDIAVQNFSILFAL